MKQLFAFFITLITISLPALGQWQQQHPQLSPDDQRRFDSYFSRWQEYRRTNNRSEVLSMEKRMQDIYAHSRISADTPYWRVASNGRGDRDRFRAQLSPDDQRRFDSYFSRWQEYRRTNNRDEMNSMEKRMQDIYVHYNIPSNTPYFAIASNSRDEDWDRWDRRERWRGRLSEDDQRRFDSYYSRWQDYHRDNNQGEMNSMERRMQDIYAQSNIPSSTPYMWVASNSRDEDWDRWDRRERWRERFSEDDQRRFDSYYSRWLDYRRDNNQSEVNSMERRMWDVMDQYKIPRDVSFDEIASGQRY